MTSSVCLVTRVWKPSGQVFEMSGAQSMKMPRGKFCDNSEGGINAVGQIPNVENAAHVNIPLQIEPLI